jgi:hypothetical protein
MGNAATVVGLLVSSALLASGCSNTVELRRPLTARTLGEINDEIEGLPTTVEIKGETLARTATAVVLGRESTALTEVRAGTEERRLTSVPTAALQRISVVKPGRGLLEGVGLGLVLGAVGGGGLGALIVGTAAEPSRDNSRGTWAAIGGVVGAVAGGFLGFTTGAIVGVSAGHRTTFEIQDPPPR